MHSPDSFPRSAQYHDPFGPDAQPVRPSDMREGYGDGLDAFGGGEYYGAAAYAEPEAYGAFPPLEAGADSLDPVPYSHAPGYGSNAGSEGYGYAPATAGRPRPTPYVRTPQAPAHSTYPALQSGYDQHPGTGQRPSGRSREWRPGEQFYPPDVAWNIVDSFREARRLHKDFLPREDVAQEVERGLVALAESYEPTAAGGPAPYRPELTRPQADCAEAALALVRHDLGEQLRLAGYGHLSHDQIPADWPIYHKLLINSTSSLMVRDRSPQADEGHRRAA